MKTKEELEALKSEYESLKSKLKELDENELSIITGGDSLPYIDIEQYNTWEVIPTIDEH